MVGVEQWAEVRRLHRVERRSIREIHRRTGLHRDTIRRALADDDPPRYRRPSAASKLDPLKPWIDEQLRSDPRIPSKRLRELAEELGYAGGKTIFDDYVREVRPRRARRGVVELDPLVLEAVGTEVASTELLPGALRMLLAKPAHHSPPGVVPEVGEGALGRGVAEVGSSGTAPSDRRQRAIPWSRSGASF